ncbi:MAG: CHAD domain-containing protein [Gemmatimonadetes bacterium]|nr:CHAD domain-containing protein [Gemmatimonadota bacterium]
MTEWSVRDPEAVRGALAGALGRPAAEGARLVALSYLHQLQGGHETTEQLHQARVALRRLRAAARDHAALLDVLRDRRIRRSLRALARATSPRRDAEMQLAWLAAEAPTCGVEAQEEAGVLRARLTAELEQRESTPPLTKAFARHLDRHVDTLFDALATYTLHHRVGPSDAVVPFGRHVAQRLVHRGARLQQRLAHVRDVDDVPALHAVRLELKRHRALLAPFARDEAALGAWFERATRGQDLLGAARDAHLVAQTARRAGLAALAVAARGVCRAHHAAFLADWCAHPDAVANACRDAAAALRDRYPMQRADGLPLEIERKYLLRGCPPEAAASAPRRIEQGWLPGETLRERLRRVTHADGTVVCTRTVKLGRPGARVEVEEATTPELFAALWPLTRGARVRKLRHVVPEGAHRWEVDVFLDRELVLAEIELESEQEEVTVPTWLAPWVARDVTDDVTFLNTNLARPEP